MEELQEPAGSRVSWLPAQVVEMGAFSIWHWIIVLGVALLLFGKGRLSSVMGDAAKGIKAFKRGMAEDDDVAAVGDASSGAASAKLPERQPGA